MYSVQPKIETPSSTMTDDSAKWNSNRRRGPSPSSTFPAKLFQILSNPEFSHIITWMPHGRSWRVLQPKVFSEVVSPKYFSHQSKYSSFMRQVNGWGFKRITRGPDRNSYYHELFVRDNPELAWTMSRRGSSSSKNSGGKDEADKEPNFYEMTGLTNSTTSAGSGANNSTGIPSQLYPPSATGGNGYDYHDGHGHLYNSNYDLTHGGTIAPHQYVQSQSLGADQQPPFHPYAVGGASSQAAGGNFPDDYSNYPPNYHGPSGSWPTQNYPSAFSYQQGFYNPYGPPSQYFSSAATPPVSEDRPLNTVHSSGQAAWSEEGQNQFTGYTGQAQPLHPGGGAAPQQPDSTPEPQQGHGWFRDAEHQGLR